MVVRRFVRALRSRADLPGPERDPSFDPAFYREAYDDLRHLDEEALERHYRLYGRNEGRWGNRALAMAALEALGGPLPPAFDPAEYLAANADLQAALPTEWKATEHFLRYGRAERRKAFKLDTDLYAELYHPGQRLTPAQLREDYERVGRRAGRIGSATALSRARGLPGRGTWIKAIRVREFALLNWEWAGQVQTRGDVIDAMLAGGFERLAPIAFDQVFDPLYYRDANPDQAGESDPALYRDWLLHGVDVGRPGSPAQHLASLDLPLTAFPEAFDWRAYAAAHGEAGWTRWRALDQLVRTGLAQGHEVPASGPDAPAFLAALAQGTDEALDWAAIALVERARTLGPVGAGGLRRLAQAYARRDRWPEAFEAYRDEAATGEGDVDTFREGARAAVLAERPEDALALLEAGRDRVAGAPAFRAAVRQAVEASFDRETAAIRRMYDTGERAAADAAMAEAAERAQARWNALDPIGAPAAPSDTRRVVVLANTDLRQCTHYRVEQKMRLLALTDLPHDVYAAGDVEAFMGVLPGAAAAIFYRLAATPANLRAIDYARRLGVPTYYEIDDLIFSEAYPDAFESYGGSISREMYSGLLSGVPLFRTAMARCDHGIASTTALARHMAPLVRTGEVFVLPNGLDDRNVDLHAPPPPRVRRDDDVLLFYGSGTKAHNTDFLELAGPALAEIMAARADVRLMIVGHLVLDARLEAFRERITTVPFVPDARGYWSLLVEADVNLAVLAPSVVADAKSEIKWLEAAVLRIPSVVSDTDRYREVLEDGVDALIARDAASWRAALTRLIDDAALRRDMGDRAHAKAVANYAAAVNARRLEALLAPALARSEAATAASLAPRRPRVLLANAFFPPQTIGGATRVVRDNLDAFLATPNAGGFDFGVACTDHGAEVSYLTRVESYGGCPVFRLSTPEMVNMDWNPLDPVTGELFAEVLRGFRPDLVHFHAAQRLTGAAVQACAEAGVPYLVTVHDAWWISDHQFLVDEQDRLRAPCEPVPLDPPAPASVGDAMARRRYLTSLLGGAEAVLGVSRTFTELYRGCGFPQAVAVPNGVPPMPAVARTPSASSRVRLAHVGGLSAHKGYGLLQAALRASAFANLELTVVDHARYGGADVLERWGATPVRIVGKTAQERMHAFYAEHDVLLAPSIWPESFGLVAREALAAGLWVLASDRGAMGEDVVAGVNGWVVDVTDPGGVRVALAEIDRDPARHLSPPPPTPLRPSDAQARELLELYRAVLAAPRQPRAVFRTRWAGQPAPDRPAPDRLETLRRSRMDERWGCSAGHAPPPGA